MGTVANPGTPRSFLLKVRDVVMETDDAITISLEIPDDLNEIFTFSAGQFLTIAVPSDLTGSVARCYSLSSTPHSGLHQITVKRTAEGYASNWLCQNLKPGHTLRVLPPSGVFTPRDPDRNLLLFAAGSGITPVISIARTALERGAAQVVLFYANRDAQSVIFAKTLRQLAEKHASRFLIVHWLESVQGLPEKSQIQGLAQHFPAYDAFVCGPAPFMKATTDALRNAGFPRSRRHQEKFITLDGNPFDTTLESIPVSAAHNNAAGTTFTLEVEIDGKQYLFDDWRGDQVLLEYMESKGIAVPFSCRKGQCSACACVLLEGEMKMKHNEVLDEEEIADGIRLACQSLPVAGKIRIEY